MNAEEARKKSLENSKEEIDRIKAKIEAAIEKGYVFIIVPHSVKEGVKYSLKEGTNKWLKENGYEVKKNSDNATELVISW